MRCPYHLPLVEFAHEFSLTELGPFRPIQPAEGLPPSTWALLTESQPGGSDSASPPRSETAPPAVLALVEAREAARVRRDWSGADKLRGEILRLGWQVQDTPVGPVVKPR